MVVVVHEGEPDGAPSIPPYLVGDGVEDLSRRRRVTHRRRRHPGSLIRSCIRCSSEQALH